MIKGIKNLYKRICKSENKKVPPNPPVNTDLQFMKNLSERWDAPYKYVDTDLRYLAGVCARGDADAMMKLSEYFSQNEPNEKAAVMWLVRAAMYGNTMAQEKLQDEIKQNQYFLEKSLLPWEHFIPGKHPNWHSGSYSGEMLNAAGLMSFNQNGYYTIAGLDKNRAILIWKETGYEPPDEDGYGAETYYDMYYMDEFFQPISGLPYLYNASSRGIRQSDSDSYYAMKEAMIKAMSKRKQIPLWTGFIPEK